MGETIDEAMLERVALGFVRVWEIFFPPLLCELEKECFVVGFVAGGLGLEKQDFARRLGIDFCDKSHRALFYCFDLGWDTSHNKMAKKPINLDFGDKMDLYRRASKACDRENILLGSQNRRYFMAAYALGFSGLDRRVADIKIRVPRDDTHNELARYVEKGWESGCSDYADFHAGDIFEYIKLLERSICLTKAQKDLIFKAYMLALVGLEMPEAIANLRFANQLPQWGAVECAIGWKRGNEEFLQRTAKVLACFVPAGEEGSGG